MSDALWTAPEHIFNENFPRSQQGDLFSYGIILSEILTRALPYSMFEDLSAKSKCCECSYFAKASEPPQPQKSPPSNLYHACDNMMVWAVAPSNFFLKFEKS